MTIGSNVKVKCPVYKNGKSFTGQITGLKKEGTFFVKIKGNDKSTAFGQIWLTAL